MKDIIDITEKKRVNDATGECCGGVTLEIKPNFSAQNHFVDDTVLFASPPRGNLRGSGKPDGSAGQLSLPGSQNRPH